MVGKTHGAGGVALALAAATFVPAFSPETVGIFGTAIFIGSSSFGALLPDIEEDSTISHYPVFNLVHLMLKLLGVAHRGLTHSILFAGTFLFMGIILGCVAGMAGFLAGAGITIGIISHIILDMLTPAGVKAFYPFGDHVSIGAIMTRSIGDLFVRWILIAVSVKMLMDFSDISLLF